MASDFDELKKMIRSVLQSTKFGYSITEFREEYQNIVGEDVPFQKFNFKSIEDLITNIPDTARFNQHNGKCFISPVANFDTLHIAKNLRDQKCSKKKPRRISKHKTAQDQRLKSKFDDKSVSVPRFNGIKPQHKSSTAENSTFFSNISTKLNLGISSILSNQKQVENKSKLLPTNDQTKTISFSKPEIKVKQHPNSHSFFEDNRSFSNQQAFYKNQLHKLVYEKQLSQPLFRVLSFIGEPNKQKFQYAASVLIEGERYYSYPIACYTPEHAEEICSFKAIESIKNFSKVSEPVESDERTLLNQIVTILEEDQFHSLLENGMKNMFRKKFNKNFPSNALDIIKKYPELIELEINEFSNNSIVRISLPTLISKNKNLNLSNDTNKLSCHEIFFALKTDFKFNLNEDSETQILPSSLTFSSSEQLWAIVKRISSPTEIILRLLKYDGEYVDLLEAMHKHYLNTSKPVNNLKIGKIYAAVYEDATFRVQINQFQNNNDPICVFLDEGYIETIERCRIFELHPNFLKLPFQAFMVTLDDLLLYENSQVAIKYLSDYISKIEDTLVVVEIKDTHYPYTVRLFDKSSSTTIDINQLILRKLKQDVFTDILFKPGVWNKGFVTEVTLNGDIYIQFESNFLKVLESRQPKLNQLCSEQPKLTLNHFKKCSPNNIYYAHYLNAWYRSKINKVEIDHVNVFFLDFGTSCKVKFAFLKSFEPEQDPLRDLPYLAVKGNLEAVPSDSSLTWSSRATYKLLNMLSEIDLVYIKISHPPFNSKPCQIQLCHKVNNEFILLNMKLDSDHKCFDKIRKQKLIDPKLILKCLEPQITLNSKLK